MRGSKASMIARHFGRENCRSITRASVLLQLRGHAAKRGGRTSGRLAPRSAFDGLRKRCAGTRWKPRKPVSVDPLRARARELLSARVPWTIIGGDVAYLLMPATKGR